MSGKRPVKIICWNSIALSMVFFLAKLHCVILLLWLLGVCCLKCHPQAVKTCLKSTPRGDTSWHEKQKMCKYFHLQAFYGCIFCHCLCSRLQTCLLIAVTNTDCQRSWLFFHNFQTLIFNKLEFKTTEKVLGLFMLFS